MALIANKDPNLAPFIQFLRELTYRYKLKSTAAYTPEVG